MDDVTANALLNNYMVKLQQDKVKPAIEEGNKFLAQNKLKPGVKTTASGLQYEVITEGQGNKPAAIDTFVAHYRGTLLNGTEFDASYNRGQPLTLGVSQVIRGWTEGLQLMPIGSKYKFWIPYDLGYGVMGQGQIPGGALLIFEVELLDVKKKQE
jgi:FKBP-type peptidyl-prolyl cis-trans isomerase FklB